MQNIFEYTNQFLLFRNFIEVLTGLDKETAEKQEKTA